MAFVRDFDLHVLDLATGRETALTTDGEENAFLNGTTDWVYWEEIWDREATGYWWSPDGTRIAYYRFDERQVAAHPLVDEIPLHPAVTLAEVPQAGRAQPDGPRRSHRRRRAARRSGWRPGTRTAISPAWTGPGGDAVAIQRLNRGQTRLDLLRCRRGRRRLRPRCSPRAGPPGSTSATTSASCPTAASSGARSATAGGGSTSTARDGKLVRPVTPEGWAIAVARRRGRGRELGDRHRLPHRGARGRRPPRAARRLDRATEEILGSLTPPSRAPTRPWSPRSGAWVHTWSTTRTLPPQSEVRTGGTARAPAPLRAARRLRPGGPAEMGVPHHPRPGGLRLPARMLKPAGLRSRRAAIR